MKIFSSDFEDNGVINKRNTCQGEDISPELEIMEVPSGAVSLAVILEDIDAAVKTESKPLFCHWIIYDIPAAAKKISAGLARKALMAGGIKQGINDFGRTGYGGPCPGKGSHRYYFRVYALDIVLDIAPDKTDWFKITGAIKGHVVGNGEIMGTYQKI
jgi:Raf kinase inhibitor-like YbhB/YbcL family protein